MPLNINQLKQLDQRAKLGQFTAEDCLLLRTLIESHRELVNLLKDPDSSLDDLYPYLPGDGNDTLSAGPSSDRIDSLPQGRDE